MLKSCSRASAMLGLWILFSDGGSSEPYWIFLKELAKGESLTKPLYTALWFDSDPLKAELCDWEVSINSI